jgi:hypothetical protein
MPAMMTRTGLEILKRSHSTFEVADGYRENYPSILLMLIYRNIMKGFQHQSSSGHGGLVTPPNLCSLNVDLNQLR